jgi:hypothetical protein
MMERVEPLQAAFFETGSGSQPVREFMQMNGIGQNFDDFMIEQGLYDEAKELAAKKLFAAKLQQETNARKPRQAARRKAQIVAAYV